jgi:hypothetical protein
MNRQHMMQAVSGLLKDLDTLEGYLLQLPVHREFTYTAILAARELHHVAKYETCGNVTTQQVRHFRDLETETRQRLQQSHGSSS